jgi:hypothetical protein
MIRDRGPLDTSLDGSDSWIDNIYNFRLDQANRLKIVIRIHSTDIHPAMDWIA